MPVVKVPAAKVTVMADAVVASPDVTTTKLGIGEPNDKGNRGAGAGEMRSIATLGHAVAQWIVVPDAPLVPLMYK